MSNHSPKPITITAPAKVNLFLHITGRRVDGYHQLESVFVRTERGDKVTVVDAEAFSLTIVGDFAAPLKGLSCQEDNLVWRAAKLLQKTAGLRRGAAITLEKNLPLAAGIGGGSGDAAATLIALNQLWGLGYDTAQMETLGAVLGADVPACLYMSPQWVTGIGENITPLSLNISPYILLVNPMVGLKTPDVFKGFQSSDAGFDAKLSQQPQNLAALTALSNSLQEPAKALCPEVSSVLTALKQTDGTLLVRMSGSGATCFALYNTLEERDAARSQMQEQAPNWWYLADKIYIT